jgi:hypothetical protein
VDQDKEQLRVVMNTLLTFQVPLKAGNFLD